MSDDDFKLNWMRVLPHLSGTTPARLPERGREVSIKAVPGGYLLSITGGGVGWQQCVSVTLDGALEIARAHLGGPLTPKEPPAT